MPSNAKTNDGAFRIAISYYLLTLFIKRLVFLNLVVFYFYKYFKLLKTETFFFKLAITTGFDMDKSTPLNRKYTVDIAEFVTM